MRNWIKGGIIFVAGAIAQRVIDRFLDWSEWVLPRAISDVSASDIIFVIGIVIGVIFIGFGIWKSREKGRGVFLSQTTTNKHDIFGRYVPDLAHLTIHYSRSTDTPDTEVPARPRYVSNNKTMNVYWVPTLLEQLIKERQINWHSHPSAEILRYCLQENRYTIHERDPTLEELGISTHG